MRIKLPLYLKDFKGKIMLKLRFLSTGNRRAVVGGHNVQTQLYFVNKHLEVDCTLSLLPDAVPAVSLAIKVETNNRDVPPCVVLSWKVTNLIHSFKIYHAHCV